jgi:hypothetical protein
MFSFLHRHHRDGRSPSEYASPSSAPPGWAPAPELSHQWGLLNEAPENEYKEAERFCERYPPTPPHLLPSDVVERIEAQGSKAWNLELPTTGNSRFQGHVSSCGQKKGGRAVVHVETKASCKDVSLLSDLPLTAGLYEIQGKVGVYYEVTVYKMEGVIAVGELIAT